MNYAGCPRLNQESATLDIQGLAEEQSTITNIMKTSRSFTTTLALLPAIGAAVSCSAPKQASRVAQNNDEKPRNVIFILSDDHRCDYMGFMGKVPYLQTPNLDFLARNGAHVRNAFVTTSLSSPSRASILTGLFSHEHTVVDNSAPMPDNLIFFPEYLQSAGYSTAFFGKWHMDNDDGRPQPGFDQWEGFSGQGTYYNCRLNINGEWTEFPKDKYSAELLTEHAIDFIDSHKDKPFFVYLSHKNVHDPFAASKEYEGIYKDEENPRPASFNNPLYDVSTVPSKDGNGKPKTGRDWYGEDRKPDWVKHQRESWHGVDFCYNGRSDFDREQRKYCQCITSMDKTIGDLLNYLRENGLDKNTLIIYMGDNGFIWGEHGLIDKRNFYEPSVRVPMIAYCPEIISPGTVIEEMVQNIDIAPTVMDACGLNKAPQMRGDSFLPMLKGEKAPDDWRHRIYYEYYWEYAFPQTPTMFGVRTDDYKYIHYHGIWDTNEFYDIKNDPDELHNLIDDPKYQDIIKGLNKDLFDWLEQTGGMEIPLKRNTRKHNDWRNGKVF